ncbi:MULTISPECIES: patatin-like phospholipase family protein [unclassified Brevundimonas]|uniref:patatin-like phospholipase family protein n=1 Tax=unclassified Brevundimonas TaxID=2622653 RepID=UPI0025C05270|nr:MULTISPECIES: patatin-like phospholipase family protein [unclassified Brevundimonas]
MSDLPQPAQPVRSRRGRRLPCAPVAHAEVKGFKDIRLTVSAAENSLAMAADRLSLPRSGWTSGRFDILALSGGAAGGAYGAGAMTGWTESGTRPEFALVTGVSTGALIAPLAFLGPAWDGKLKDAYTGGHARQLLSPRRMAPMFSGGLLKSDALHSLIEPFVDMKLIEAVAQEHARGRRLLVATTDLDHQACCIWDMGAIASHGGDGALKLFREVLVASASLPGIFSPHRITTEYDGCIYEEMHVDGGVSAPLFIIPDGLLRWNKLGKRLKGGRVHVIVNTMLDPEPRPVAPNLPAVMTRSFEAMLRFSYRQSLITATTLCAAQGIPLKTAAIPNAVRANNLLNFDTAAMEALFNEGRKRALSGELWSTEVPATGLERLAEALHLPRRR